MANPIIRPLPIYVNSDKVAEATEGTWEIDGAVALQIADGGTGISRGRVTVKASIKTIVPVKGQRVKLMQLCLGQKDVTLELFAEGQFIKADGILSSYGYEWNHANGTATGSSSFIGATPEVNG